MNPKSLFSHLDELAADRFYGEDCFGLGDWPLPETVPAAPKRRGDDEPPAGSAPVRVPTGPTPSAAPAFALA